MGVSLQLALPLFILQLIVSVSFSLMLVYFRHSRIDFWGVVLCVLMLSISSLFYIIVGQFVFSKMFRLAPISGYAPGLDAVKFLVLPIALSLLSRLGGEARLYRAMFLEEIGKDYVRTARAKGLSAFRVVGIHALRNAYKSLFEESNGTLAERAQHIQKEFGNNQQVMEILAFMHEKGSRSLCVPKNSANESAPQAA